MAQTPQYVNRAGDFLVKIVKPQSGWIGESGEKQTPFIRIIGEIIDDGTGIDADVVGQLATYNAWLSNAAFDKTIQRLAEVFGWDGDLGALASGMAGFEDLQARMTVEMETYTDKDGKSKVKAKVAWLNAVDHKPKQMDAAKVNNIVTAMQSRSKALAKLANAAKLNGAPKPATPKPAPTRTVADNISSTAKAEAGKPQHPADDDVPF